MAGTEEETESVWWAAPRFVVSAVAVILLVIAGIILFVVVGNNDPSDAAPVQPPAPSPAASSAPPTTSTALEESVCGLDATGGSTLTTPPADVEWEFLGGIAAPKSAEHGPGVVDAETGVRSCYSRTPEGALLAAAGQAASSGDPNLYLETVRALSVDGPGKDITVAGAQRSIGESGTTAPIKIAGFRLLAYNDDEATVEIVASVDNGTELVYFTSSAVMMWTDGDWYTKYKDDGSSGPVDGEVSDLSGYVTWGPTGG